MSGTGDADMEDTALLARIAAGDERALAALYDRHGGRAFALACRILDDPEAAEEVVLDVFLSIWRNAAAFTPERGRFTTWLFALVRNRAIDVLRRHRARPLEARVEAEELHQAVREALAALPEPQRRVLELAYFQGWTHREIAKYLGEPLGTVKSRLRLALHKVHEWLAQRGLVP